MNRHCPNIELNSSARNILREICLSGMISQNELAAKLGVSHAAVNRQVLQLSDLGLIRKITESDDQRGRPCMRLSLETEKNLFLGVRIGETCVEAVLLNFELNVIRQLQTIFPVAMSGDQFELIFHDLILDMTSYAQLHDAGIRSAYVSFVGLLHENGSISSINNPALDGFNFSETLERDFNLKSNGNSIIYSRAISEMSAQSPLSTTMVIDWDNGIGMVMVYHYRFLQFNDRSGGKDKGLWDIAHVSIDPDGPPCRCGNTGCLEHYTGLLALAAQCGFTSVHEFKEALRNREPGSTDAIRRAAKVLGAFICPIIKLFGVGPVIICGSMAEFVTIWREEFNIGCFSGLSEKERKEVTITAGDSSSKSILRGSGKLAVEFFLRDEKYIYW